MLKQRPVADADRHRTVRRAVLIQGIVVEGMDMEVVIPDTWVAHQIILDVYTLNNRFHRHSLPASVV
jgi:hypothetical protein